MALEDLAFIGSRLEGVSDLVNRYVDYRSLVAASIALVAGIVGAYIHVKKAQKEQPQGKKASEIDLVLNSEEKRQVVIDAFPELRSLQRVHYDVKKRGLDQPDLLDIYNVKMKRR